MKGKALVIFKGNLTSKSEEWLSQFDIVLSPTQIQTLTEPGNVLDASEITRQLSLVETIDGVRLAKSVNYKGFELWWIHYNDLMHRFSLPYTQYRELLKHLVEYREVSFIEAPFPELFRHFLEAHGARCEFMGKTRRGLPFGVLLQVGLTILFLPWLVFKRAPIMLWTSDQFDRETDYDFRLGYIYKELRNRKIPFVEFVRSLEPTKTVLRHALVRRRPVVYSYAISNLVNSLSTILPASLPLNPKPHLTSEEKFWFSVASHYLGNARSSVWSIKVIKVILKLIGTRSAIIDAASSRTLHEIIACKLEGIKVFGIQHGASMRDYNVSDFMPEFDGEKALAVDKFGVWSEWFREHHLRNSRAYKPDGLVVSGPMRPFEDKDGAVLKRSVDGPIRVLFISEQLAAPEEVMPYLRALLESPEMEVCLKIRPYQDGFENWLRENHFGIYKKIGKGRMVKGSMSDALRECDVVVGAASTGVLEALLEPIPFVFFQTKKWGDHFELKSFDSQYRFFAENPQELIASILKSREVPIEVLIKLQNRYFGDPYKNGSKWVVEEALKQLR